MEESKRITFTLRGKRLEMLKALADSMGRDPGAVARDIVTQTIDGIEEIFEGAADTQAVIRKMYRMAFSRVEASLDELENTTK